RQLLDRRSAVMAEAGPARRGEDADHDGDQQQREDAEQPDRQRYTARPGGAPSLHQSLTSKNPCQPSSVNSDWWAWNMYRPGCAKRHSRIPRWPWQSITVSVSSLGVFDVPVG